MPTLNISALSKVKTSTPIRLFQYLKTDCKPIATKSRRHSQAVSELTSYKVKRLLREGLIEFSNSTWRAQLLVVTQENHKRRMVIDYSQTRSHQRLSSGGVATLRQFIHFR